MFRFSVVLVTLGAFLIGPAEVPAEALTDEAVLAKNAALTYWRAFALLPKLDDDQQEAVRRSLDRLGPVDEKLIPIIKSTEPSLKELHRAAKMPSCVWGTAFDEGVHAMMPHFSKARVLSRLACLRAQLRFEQGQAAGAIEDATAVMALGRHAATDKVLIAVLVDYAIERQAIRLVAAYLPRLEPGALNRLSRNLDALPAGVTVHDAMLAEKKFFLEWAIRESAKEGTKEKLLQFLENSDDPAVAAFKGLSPAQLRKSLIDLRAFYDKLAKIALLPPEKVKKAEADLKADPGLEGLAARLAKMLSPAAAASRQNEAAYQVRLAMLKAAIAVARHGRQALKRKEHRDPFGDGPFKYSAFDGGFELTSKLADREGEPVSLTVGRRAAE